MDTVSENKTLNVGDLLRQGRLRQRLSIMECSKRTHIAPRYLEALEAERWEELPSESHRAGFLKLYARFLGVPVDDVVTLYRNRNTSAPTPAKENDAAKRSSTRDRYPLQSRTMRWSFGIPHLIGGAIIALLLAWLLYHALNPQFREQGPMGWMRRRAPKQARLVPPKTPITNQKIRIHAEANSWLRVTTQSSLLFEGILPAGSSKEWSGVGPFQLKIGNVRALSVFWNDQPVDLLAGARGAINEIRLPPQ